MNKLTFITGNPKKADNLSKYLGVTLDHRSLELAEIQSLDLNKIVEHKARQAYDILGVPVLVEDSSLELAAMGGKLPGPFIKFFMENMPQIDFCRLLNGLDKQAVARAIYVHFDGQNFTSFDCHMKGSISSEPRGHRGFGWDDVFIPEGLTKVASELNENDYEKYWKKLKTSEKLLEFLRSRYQ